MVFPVDNTQAVALANIQALAKRAKTQMTQFKDLTAAGNITLSQAKTIQGVVNNILDQWAVFASTPGLQQYARDQFDNQALDIISEYNTMRTEMTDIKTWLDTNIPAEQEFTPTQTSGFRIRVDDFLLTVG